MFFSVCVQKIAHFLIHYKNKLWEGQKINVAFFIPACKNKFRKRKKYYKSKNAIVVPLKIIMVIKSVSAAGGALVLQLYGLAEYSINA